MAGTVLSRPTYTNDDGSNTVGTVEDVAFWTDVFNRIDALAAAILTGTGLFEKLALNVGVTATTGTVDDFALDGLASGAYTGVSTVLFNGGSAVTYRGWANGLQGRLALFVNISTSAVTFQADDGTHSTAANRFLNGVVVPAGGAALLTYNTTSNRWVVAALALGWPAWTGMSFSGDWGNHGGGFGNGRYRLDPTGKIVYLSGMVKSTGGKTGVSFPVTTLPAGYRPAATVNCFGLSVVGAINAAVNISIDASGNVVVDGSNSPTTSSYVAFDGIFFAVDQ